MLVSCAQAKEYSEKIYSDSGLNIVTIGSESHEITMTEQENTAKEVEGFQLDAIKIADYESNVARFGGYAFSNLSEEEQIIYYEIYGMIDEMEEVVTVSTVDEELLSHIYYCVMSDHPQFYYVNGYSGMKYLENEEIIRIEVYPEYYMTEAEIEQYQRNIDEYVARCTAQTPMFGSEYERAKSVYEFVVLNTQYNLDAPLNQTICSVATYGESVCQGYAEMVQYLLNEMGIFATVVSGVVKSGENHAWNLVKIDGEYYYMDATWGDPEYDVTEEEETPINQMVNYDYLLLNEQQIGITHAINTTIPMPVCTSTKANYYRMENLYFEFYDKERLREIVGQAYETSQKVVSFQCSSVEVYNQIYTKLIDEGEIFDLLIDRKTTIAYSSNDSYLVLTIWID